MTNPSPVQGASLMLMLASLSVSLLLARLWHNNAGQTRKLGLSPWAWGLLVWQAMIALLAWTGFFAVYTQPWRALPTVGIALAVGAWLALRPANGEWLRRTPRSFWLGLQSFRFPLELLLYSLFLRGVIGQQMTFAGLNFDIAVGVSAPVMAFLAWRFGTQRWMPRLTLVWNVFGLLLLANIVVIAVLSIPFSFQLFTQGPPNRMVTAFPFVWLPTFLVPLAFYAHLVSIRLALHDLTQSGSQTNPI